MNSLKTAKEKIEFFETNTPEEFVFEAGYDTALTVNFFSMMRSLQWLHNMACHYKGGGQVKVSYRNVKGLLKSVTKYAFIKNGLPKREKGLKEILNLKNQKEIMLGLKRFEAIVRLVCVGNKKIDRLSESEIQEQIQITQMAVADGREAYNEHDWWTEIKGANNYKLVIGEEKS